MASALPTFLSALIVAGVIAIIALLYWLRPPARTVVVPSSLIWDRVMLEVQSRPERLRWWLSLVLAIMIAIAIASAIVASRDAYTGATEPKFVLIIDNSPTMAARTADGTTRWEHALTRARALIAAQPDGAQIWLTDTLRRIDEPAFQDRQAALAQLAQLRVSYGRLPALALPQQPAGIETAVITDGVLIGAWPESARLESVFEPVENAGITGFEVRALPAEPGRHLAYVELFNAGNIETLIDLAISGADGKRVTRELRVAAGAVRREMIDVSNFDSGPLRASIAVAGDALTIDDIAYAVLPVSRQQRVALVSEGNPYLEQALRVQPRVSMTLIAPARFIDDRGFDALVFDRFAPKSRPRVPALLFRPPAAPFLPAAAQWLPEPIREISAVSATAWDATHPLLENMTLGDLSVDRATLYRLQNRARQAQSVLASGPGNVPLIVVQEAGVRWILFAFGLDQSNFALHSGFPIFLGNALGWMLGEQVASARGLGLIEVPVPGARVLAPDGLPIPSYAFGQSSVFEIDRPGLFTLITSDHRSRVVANLFDRKVTGVNASRITPAQPGAGNSAGVHWASGFDAWFTLLLAAALLLLFEWWTWNRRLTV